MKTVQSGGLRRPAQDGTAGLPCAARLVPALAGLDEGAAGDVVLERDDGEGALCWSEDGTTKGTASGRLLPKMSRTEALSSTGAGPPPCAWERWRCRNTFALGHARESLSHQALLSSLQFCLAGRVKILGFGFGENSQNVSQVARGVPDHLCASVLQALAKSFSEFQENTFVVRIAELRLGPLPHGTFRFENTLFHSPTPDRQRLILFAEHGLEEGFNQYVH